MTTFEINALEVADRVLASSGGVYSLTAVEAMALAGRVKKLNTGIDPVMPAVLMGMPIKASLAASLALAVTAYDQSRTANAYAMSHLEREDADAADAAREAFYAAFFTVKTRFEEEFPND